MASPGALASYRSALAHRDLRLLFLSQIVSASGSWAYNVALAVYVFERTHSATWVSAVFLVKFVPSMVASPYGGILAERFERVRLLVTADLLMLAWQVLLTVTVLAHGPVALALLFAGLTAISYTPYLPAVAALIPQVAGEDDLAAANALNGTIDNLVVIVGPGVGAMLLLAGSPAITFAVNAATFAFAAGTVHRMRVRSRPSDVTAGGTAGPLGQMAAGLQAIAQSRTVLVLVGFSVLASFVYGTDTVLFIYISRELLGTGATGYGYLLAAMGVGGIVTAGLVNQLAARPRLGAIITIGMTVYCVPTALLLLVHSPVVAVGLEILRGGGTLVVDVLAITALQRSVSPAMVARVFGVFFALVLAAISLGSLLGGLLIGTVHLDATLLIVGLVIPALAACAYPFLHRMDSGAVRHLALIAPRIEVLSRLGIFAAGTRSVQERLAGACSERAAAAGEVIIREGDPADAFYVLLAGSVEVSARGEGAVSRQLRVLEVGSYFGEIGLLEGIPRTATVTALGACSLYRIDGADFLDALTSSPASQMFLEGAKTGLARSHPSYRSRLEAAVVPPTQP